MSGLQDRSAARLPLVPDHIVRAYADVLARLPRVDLTIRRPIRRTGATRDLPAVGSFYG